MKNSTHGEPFHMSEVEGDALILPEGTNVKTEDQPEATTSVDIGTLKTDPEIS
jgi:hypothetical protein